MQGKVGIVLSKNKWISQCYFDTVKCMYLVLCVCRGGGGGDYSKTIMFLCLLVDIGILKIYIM